MLVLAAAAGATMASAAVKNPARAADDIGVLTCSSIPSTHDPNVIKIVHQVGTDLRASDRVMLAAFETGWVESHMNNLPCGDLDSLGVFQQRPSQDWGTREQILNVAFASNSFFVRAIPWAAAHPAATAGQVAQAVQRSAFPDRYDQAQSKALALIDEAHRLVNPPIGDGSVIARNNGDGTYLEALLAGGHAFALSHADKAELGLGRAQVIATETFNALLAAPVANGTVIAKKTSSGVWVEAVTAYQKAYALTQADKTALGLGGATGIPARYFDGLVAVPVADRAVLAKRVASGAWMEAVVAGGRAFALSSADKAALGLGHASRIPERSFDVLIDKMIDDGTVVAKRTDSGAWVEALTVGGKAFGLSSADKADLGLGHAIGIPARGFDSLAAAGVADGTVIAKKTATGAWVEALVVGGKAYGVNQTDKTELGLGHATALPARYFDGLASRTIDGGTVIAKKTASGAWMEALTAGGRAFVLTSQDKAWLGLGRATPIPARYFDGLINTPIAERTVIARRNENNTYLEAYILNGRAIPLTQEEKIRLGLGRATLIPTAAFNALL